MPLLSKFISDCCELTHNPQQVAKIAEAMRRLLPVLASTLQSKNEATVLYSAPNLLIASIQFPPFAATPAHTHGVWSVIGLISGSERNSFYTHTETGLKQTHTRALQARDCITLDANVIHSVKNPHPLPSMALHVYGGNILEAPRSMWDPVTGRKHAFEQTQFEAWCELLSQASIHHSTA